VNIKLLKTHDEIAKSFDAFLELRPHLTSEEIFVSQVIQQQKEGYEIVAVIENDDVVACIGFRIMTMLAWGKILYIDDLIVKEKYRGKGYGKTLLDHITKVAKENACHQVHLDTGYTRHAAHRVYLNQGFELHCHHLALKLI
jgi:GNAT superfamily N-acetyltransferase